MKTLTLLLVLATSALSAQAMVALPPMLPPGISTNDLPLITFIMQENAMNRHAMFGQGRTQAQIEILEHRIERLETVFFIVAVLSWQVSWPSACLPSAIKPPIVGENLEQRSSQNRSFCLHFTVWALIFGQQRENLQDLQEKETLRRFLFSSGKSLLSH